MKEKKDKYFDLKIHLNNFKGNSGIDIVNKIQQILKDNGINPNSILIQDTNMCKFFGLSKSEILESRKINWFKISEHAQLSEGFIRFADDKLDWDWICYRVNKDELKVGKEFKDIYQYNFEEYEYSYDDEIPDSGETRLSGDINKMNKKKDDCKPDISNHHNRGMRSPYDSGLPFIPPDKPYFKDVPEFKLPPLTFFENKPEFQGSYIGDPMGIPSFIHPMDGNVPLDIENMSEDELNDLKEDLAKQYGIPPEAVVINYIDPNTGINHENITNNPYYNNPELAKEENKKQLMKTYITMDNYKKELLDMNHYDSNMWSMISRKLWLSPEFVDHFKDKIYFAGLVNENPHFVELMKCDWFFDKYIDTFKELKVVQNVMTRHLKPEFTVIEGGLKLPKSEM